MFLSHVLGTGGVKTKPRSCPLCLPRPNARTRPAQPANIANEADGPAASANSHCSVSSIASCALKDCLGCRPQFRPVWNRAARGAACVKSTDLASGVIRSRVKRGFSRRNRNRQSNDPGATIVSCKCTLSRYSIAYDTRASRRSNSNVCSLRGCCWCMTSCLSPSTAAAVVLACKGNIARRTASRST